MICIYMKNTYICKHKCIYKIMNLYIHTSKFSINLMTRARSLPIPKHNLPTKSCSLTTLNNFPSKSPVNSYDNTGGDPNA